MARNWRDVRAEANLDESAVAAERGHLLTEVRPSTGRVRTRHQLTQEQLAARMGVSQARVSKIEKGELTDTEIGTVEK
jgi:predicted XRE-type DNA-binding protein